MNAWVIQAGEPLPTDPGRPRVWRSGLIARELAARGHQVRWWASTFAHVEKRFRAERETTIAWDSVLIHLLHSPGYARNISLQRIYDHRVLARHFRVAALRLPVPDVIHCAFPTIELSLEAVNYGKRHGVPVVIDTRDLWPDLFLDAVPDALKGVARVALAPLYAETRAAFRGATAISGQTPGFVRFGLAYAGRPGGPLDRAFPFAYPAAPPTDADIGAARAFWQTYDLAAPDSRPVVCFFGTFGAQRALDFETVIEAARVLSERRVAVRFVLCGDGPRLAGCRALAAGLESVIFPGWVGPAQIWTLMRTAQVGLLPYLPSTAFSLNLPNKAVEYFSAGLPVLTSLRGGYLEEVLRTADCGYFYDGADARSLADSVQSILAEPHRLRERASRALGMFAREYAAEQVYGALADYLEQLGAKPGRTLTAGALAG